MLLWNSAVQSWSPHRLHVLGSAPSSAAAAAGGGSIWATGAHLRECLDELALGARLATAGFLLLAGSNEHRAPLGGEEASRCKECTECRLVKAFTAPSVHRGDANVHALRQHRGQLLTSERIPGNKIGVGSEDHQVFVLQHVHCFLGLRACSEEGDVWIVM